MMTTVQTGAFKTRFTKWVIETERLFWENARG